MQRKMCQGIQVKLQEEGCEESCERRHREGYKGDAREIKKVRSGNTGGENRVDLKGKMRYTRTLKIPHRWWYASEEVANNGRIHTGQVQSPRGCWLVEDRY